MTQFIKKFRNYLFLMFITLISCKHKTDFNNLTEVSYSKDIAPIINSNCAFSGCHGNNNGQQDEDEFILTTYSDLIKGGIEPGSPKKSKLYSTLKSLNDDDIMPRKPYSPLTEKQIQLIYIWIGQGAKNN
jgi:hypothetical protein